MRLHCSVAFDRAVVVVHGLSWSVAFPGQADWRIVHQVLALPVQWGHAWCPSCCGLPKQPLVLACIRRGRDPSPHFDGKLLLSWLMVLGTSKPRGHHVPG
jgi:hypothetical protein